MKNTNDIASKVLIEDIVKSKGYKVYRNWKRPKKDVHDLVNSLNAQINKPTKTRIVESEKDSTDSFKQLEFKF